MPPYHEDLSDLTLTKEGHLKAIMVVDELLGYGSEHAILVTSELRSMIVMKDSIRFAN